MLEKTATELSQVDKINLKSFSKKSNSSLAWIG